MSAWLIRAAVVLLIIAVPLWRELSMPGHTGWNIFLALLLAGLAVAAYFLIRFIRRHAGEIGEARFDTSNPDRSNG